MGPRDPLDVRRHRGALIKVLDKPHLDLTTPLGRGFTFPQRHGRGRARQDPQACQRRPHWGTRFGRKPKLTDYQRDEALKRLEAGENCRAIAKTMAVHHATIARLGT